MRGARARGAHGARELRGVGGLDVRAPATELGELGRRRLLGLCALGQCAQLLAQLRTRLCEQDGKEAR